MNPRSLTSLAFSLALLFASPAALRAETSAAPADAPATFVAADAGSAVTREQLLSELARQLSERFSLQGELQVELIRAWSPPTAAIHPVELVITECPATPAPSLLVRVRLQGAGPVIDSTLSIRLQLFRDVWVARTPLERGQPFDPGQLDTRRIDVLQQRDSVPATEGDSNFVYASSVPAGRMLAWRDLGRRPLIRKGQVIEVAAVDGALTITTKALALENGAAGDTIKLRNLDSKKDFSALVVSEARARVRF